MYNIPAYSFQAGSKGLKASIVLDFTIDLNIFVPLEMMFQGQPVHAKSIWCSNLSSNITVDFYINNSVDTIPPYSNGVIDISHAGAIIFKANAPFKMAIEILDYKMPEGFTSRGNAPNNSYNDPSFSTVTGLFHMEGIDGGIKALDTKNGTITTLDNTQGALSTNRKLFGNSSYKRVINSVGTINAFASASASYIACCEFAINFDVIPEGDVSCIIGMLYSYDGISGDVIVAKCSGGKVTNILLCDSIIIASGTLKDNVNISVNFNINEWHYFCFEIVDIMGPLAYTYIDGVYKNSRYTAAINNIKFGVYNFVPFSIGGNVSAISDAFSFYLDELRFGTKARYLGQTYDLQTDAFLDQ